MKKIMLYMASMLVIGLSSCDSDKFFELQAPPVTVWKKVADLELGINTPYKNSFIVQTNSEATSLSPYFRMQTLHIIESDMARYIGDNAGFNMMELYNRDMQRHIPTVQRIYGRAYLVISQCNFIIDFINSGPFPKATESDQININRVKGEALFLRAFTYYILSSVFAPIYDQTGANDGKFLTLRTGFSTSLDIAQNNTPVSVKEIWEQMIKDLTEASSLLPLKWENGMPESYKYGRATKHAALAILSKIECHMGRYSEALSSLNSILDDSNQSRALDTDPMAPFTNNLYKSQWNSSEIIFYALFADPIKLASTRHYYQEAYFFNKTFPHPGDYRSWWTISLDTEIAAKCNMMVDGKVTSEWENDKRRKLWHYWKGADPTAPLKNYEYIESPGVAIYVGKDDPLLMIDKYYRTPAPSVASNEPCQNLPIVRSAEMYLLRAAVKIQKGDASGAADDIDVVRRRSWDTSKSGAFQPLATATWDNVEKEWIRELAFEQSFILFKQMFSKPIKGRKGESDITAPYSNRYWLIPTSETDFNK